MERTLKRIVTGFNEHGRSIIEYEDCPVQHAGLLELWITDKFPVDNASKGDLSKRKLKLEPPKNGTLLRYFTIHPHKDRKDIGTEELQEHIAAHYESIGATHCQPDTSRSPYMHRTSTLDYIVLLEGEVTLLLEEGEVDLKQFDVVVQRGTNHAWINKGSKPALLVGVMIEAEPLPT